MTEHFGFLLKVLGLLGMLGMVASWTPYPRRHPEPVSYCPSDTGYYVPCRDADHIRGMTWDL